MTEYMKRKVKIIILGLVTCLSTINVFAQQKATVKSFVQTNDHIPVSDRRNDLNNTPCALVKVQVVDDIERVEGNKIGKVISKGVEKWIYMCKGSRNMKLHLKNHLPIMVMFKDYKINGLESNRVYELIIETPDNISTSTQTLILNYSPANANVLIDSKVYQGNGRVETKLPIGEHSYSISAYGYVSSEGMVKLNQQGPREITENLTPEKKTQKEEAQKQSEDYFISAENELPSNAVNVGVNGNLLTLKISPFYAKISIDGKTYEADEEGELTVPMTYGMHTVEVTADGFIPNTTNIYLIKSSISKKIKLAEQKEKKAQKGMHVVNEGNGIEVGKTGNLLIVNLKYTDDMKISVDNHLLTLNNQEKINTLVFPLPFGTHDFKVECPGFETEYFNVNIGKSKVTRTIKLKKNKKNKGKNSLSAASNTNGVISGQNGNDVSFSVKPVYAIVIIDGIAHNPNLDGQLTCSLLYGIHKISIEASGYEPKQFALNVGKSKISKKISLKRISTKKKK